MRYEILNRFSGEIQVAAEIDCPENANDPTKLGQAVQWAVKNRANLPGANLPGADLPSANLPSANLRAIKHDYWGVLVQASKEIPFLIQALKKGTVDGTTYNGPCACLCGTIAHAQGRASGISLPYANSNSPVERFFWGIRPGNTPETNPASALAVEWAEEFLALLHHREMEPSNS